MEIITGIERRRRWRQEEKLRIVAETEEPGACFADVARRHALSRGLLWNWRNQVRRGVLSPHQTPAFLPIHMMGEPMADQAHRSHAAAMPGGPTGQVELAPPDGTTVRIGSDVSLSLLRRVLTALHG